MRDDDSPRRGKLLRPEVILAGTVVFVVIAVAVAIIIVPQWLLNNWMSEQPLDAATVRLAMGAATQTGLLSVWLTLTCPMVRLPILM
ncbi:hypothetical protein SAMN06296378_2067 [Salinibacterium xinjiangense]|uniref:Uncharacterized protein n=1 Tax=Salinibacterium xinjiangense TaxID=386302 RepID=A0A2C8ZVP1_9MICO|nr:hypothetical protein [Salinibacterium xinjiangense]SOE69820.1 hypothetical protein SAMN06296378_2067 [Salinibacterium xinjiangense]